ncbi:MAG: 3-keto-disaccharide hydrolase [Bacteroidota bacterium]
MRNVKFIAVLLSMFAAGGLLSSCGPANQQQEETEETAMNTLTPQETEDGFFLLFDGESFEGWRGYNKEAFPAEGWIIEEGALKVTGAGTGEAGGQGGDIIYDRKFLDFHLKLEWKVSPGGNSGIFYLGQEIEGEPIWKSAPEMQILDNEKHIDANLGVDGNRQAGSLYDLIPADPQNAKPAGEWNLAEVLVYRGTVVHKQNGEVVLEYHLGTPDWEEKVANSKFADFPWFGKYEPGYISLQDHGDDVWFRNIRIKEL